MDEPIEGANVGTVVDAFQPLPLPSPPHVIAINDFNASPVDEAPSACARRIFLFEDSDSQDDVDDDDGDDFE